MISSSVETVVSSTEDSSSSSLVTEVTTKRSNRNNNSSLHSSSHHHEKDRIGGGIRMTTTTDTDASTPPPPDVDLDDPEGSLLELLAFFSEQPQQDLQQQASSTTNVAAVVVPWLWNQLNPSKQQHRRNNDNSGKFDSPTLQYTKDTLSAIRSVLASKSVSPLDLHATVKQAIVFAATTTTTTSGTSSTTTSSSIFIHVCLLLCVYALRNRPSTLTSRWKRWQSLVFETIALYQEHVLTMNSRNEDESASSTENDDDTDKMTTTTCLSVDDIDLWMNFVLPACRHVQKALPTANENDTISWTALLAGVVGTTSRLVPSSIVYTMKKNNNKKTEAPSPLAAVGTLPFLKAIGPVISYRYEKWVWCQPWREAASRRSTTTEDSSTSQLAFQKYKGDLSWWTQHADQHENVCGMSTEWSSVGIAYMSLTGFSFRALVLSPTYIWNLWFPHVGVLLLESEESSSVCASACVQAAVELLESILSTVNGCSKTLDQQSLPSSPIGVLQLLMNRLMAVAPHQHASSSYSTQLDSPAEIMGYAKQILAKYKPSSQVRVVQTLVEDCPQPSLIPKMIDLLRPLVTTADQPEPALWEYLATFWNEMMNDCVDSDDKLCNVDHLLSRVEPYVSIISMVQLWLMVKQELPLIRQTNELDKKLSSFNDILKRQLKQWSDSSNASMPPTDYYRLFLLEGSIQQVLSLMQGARGTLGAPVEVPTRPPVMGPMPPP